MHLPCPTPVKHEVLPPITPFRDYLCAKISLMVRATAYNLKAASPRPVDFLAVVILFSHICYYQFKLLHLRHP